MGGGRTLTMLCADVADDGLVPALVELVEGHDGTHPRPTGTTLLASFGDAGSGICAAVELQRCCRLAGAPGCRIGLSTADCDGESPHSPVAAAEADELMRRAEAGGILATELTLQLAGRVDLVQPLRAVELVSPWRGEALATVELVWSPAAAICDEEVAAPPQCRPTEWMPYLEREAATDLLRTAWSSVLAGSRQVVVVEGEAGSGKSRLAAEWARVVHPRGGLVIWGACTSEGELPFEPFVDGLHRLLSELTVEDRRRIAGEEVADLALLLPRSSLVDRPPVAATDPATDRYWMSEAVARLLHRLGDESPVLFVIDDLHWARPSTALLVDHLLRSDIPSRLCLLLTVRTELSERSEAARDLLARLPRYPDVTHVPVEGFDAEEAEQLMMLLAGHGLDDGLVELASRFRNTSNGNAFLFGELWRDRIRAGELRQRRGRWSFQSDERTLPSPDSVRTLVERQVGSFDAATMEVLRTAALVGDEFEAELVGDAAGRALEAVVEHLRPAVEAGLVRDADAGRYRFRHDLIARSLSDTLPSAERCAIHLAVARALERRRPDRLDRIAWHHAHAVPVSDPVTAVEWARRAADRALAASSYGDAAATLAVTLDVVDDPALRADLLTDLGQVAVLAGDVDASLAAANEAAAIAVETGDRRRLIAAALGYHELIWRTDGSVDHRPGLLEAALDVADGCDRARLLATKATSLAYTGDEVGALAIGDEAISVARRHCDTRTTARVMHAALFAGWMDPERIPERLELAMEAYPLARESGDDEAMLRARMKHAFAHGSLGDGRALAADVEEMYVLARRLRQPWLLTGTAAFRAMVSLAEGDLDAAELATADFAHWSERLVEPGAGVGVLTFGLRREQGRVAELRRFAELLSRTNTGGQSWRPGLAALYAEVGMVEEAHRLLDEALADGAVAVPADDMRLVTLSYLADACWVAGHPDSDLVYRELLPWSGLCISSPGLVCYGAADRYLGTLARAAGRPADAERHLRAALRLEERAGWPTWAVHSRFELGNLLAGRPGQATEARDQFTAALDDARRIGMVAMIERCEEALANLERPTWTADGHLLTPRELDVLRLVAEGRSNREIGERLHTSRHTVANQMHSILTKTGASNRAEAVAWATRHRLLDPD